MKEPTSCSRPFKWNDVICVQKRWLFHQDNHLNLSIFLILKTMNRVCFKQCCVASCNIIEANVKWNPIRMHLSRMCTACCNCHFSCHAGPSPHLPLPYTPPVLHTPLPCMPPAMHAPCHACPLPCTHPYHAPLPLSHVPLPCMSPCHACHPTTHTPTMYTPYHTCPPPHIPPAMHASPVDRILDTRL